MRASLAATNAAPKAVSSSPLLAVCSSRGCSCGYCDWSEKLQEWVLCFPQCAVCEYRLHRSVQQTAYDPARAPKLDATERRNAELQQKYTGSAPAKRKQALSHGVRMDPPGTDGKHKDCFACGTKEGTK